MDAFLGNSVSCRHSNDFNESNLFLSAKIYLKCLGCKIRGKASILFPSGR